MSSLAFSDVEGILESLRRSGVDLGTIELAVGSEADVRAILGVPPDVGVDFSRPIELMGVPLVVDRSAPAGDITYRHKNRS